MSNPFASVMQEKTNEQLISILSSAEGDYQAAAIEAARTEFDSRNLSETSIEEIKKVVSEKENIIATKSDEPLDTAWKVLTFIFPGALVQLYFIAKFRTDGYVRKAKELSRWTLYGFAFYFGLVLLMALLIRMNY